MPTNFDFNRKKRQRSPRGAKSQRTDQLESADEDEGAPSAAAAHCVRAEDEDVTLEDLQTALTQS